MSDVTIAFLRKLLRSWEKAPGSKQRAFAVDYSKFATTAEEDEFFGILNPSFSDGSLEPIRSKGGLNSRIEHIRLIDPAPIYVMLGLAPVQERGDTWLAVLSKDAEDWERPVIEAIISDWLSDKKWQKKLGSSDIDTILTVQKIARAIRSGEWKGKDHRTVCSRVVEDSKFIETRGAAVFAYCYHGQDKPGDTTRSIIEALGLQKSGVPVLISGPFTLADYPIGESVDYLGIGGNDLHKVSLARQPKYVLTIENRESFHRHAVEINQSREGLILYTGGQPSHNVQVLYAHLLTRIDQTVPVYHWSDIDLGGLEIFSTLHRSCARLCSHLMTVDILRAFGRTPTTAFKLPVKIWPSEIADIAQVLNGDSPLTLEQEILDPVSPLWNVSPGNLDETFHSNPPDPSIKPDA